MQLLFVKLTLVDEELERMALLSPDKTQFSLQEKITIYRHREYLYEGESKGPWRVDNLFLSSYAE